MRRLEIDISGCIECPYRGFATIREPPNWCNHPLKPDLDASIEDDVVLQKTTPEWCPLPDKVGVKEWKKNTR